MEPETPAGDRSANPVAGLVPCLWLSTQWLADKNVGKLFATQFDQKRLSLCPTSGSSKRWRGRQARRGGIPRADGNLAAAIWMNHRCEAVKYWEIIADNLSKDGCSWDYCSTVNRSGEVLFWVDAHRDDGQRFIVQLYEILKAFLELENAIQNEVRR